MSTRKWQNNGLNASQKEKSQKVNFSFQKFAISKNGITFAPQFGALAHLVERNTGSVEVSGSSPLCSTIDFISD